MIAEGAGYGVAVFAVAVECAEDECVGGRVVGHDECVLVVFSGVVGCVALFGEAGVVGDGAADFVGNGLVLLLVVA